MEKFECNSCVNRKCTACLNQYEVPKYCTLVEDLANWHKVKEEQKLPKLTVEVFNRPDCPEWANYAGLNKDGRVIFYEDKNSPGAKADIGFFDATDWKSSLIERPAKALPDWFKVERHGYDNGQKRYFEIVHIYEKWVDIKYLDNDENETVCRSDMSKCSEARKRPFNDKEMQNLVGKIMEHATGRYLITACAFFSTGDWKIEVADQYYSAELLLKDDFTIDGKPCYVLEHKNDRGQWVE